jgi:hypothetical protein
MAEPALASREWLRRKEAAQYLETLGCPISMRTLEKYANNSNEGRGPPFFRFRWKTVRYKRLDLERWAKDELKRVE